MPQAAYSYDKLVMIARDNFEKMTVICEQMDKEGYWAQPEKILKQSCADNLDLYVQSLLYHMADTCKRLTQAECDFILDLCTKNLLGMSSDDYTGRELAEAAKRVVDLPPVLFQLCGVYDNDKKTDRTGYFLDALVNIMLCLASVEARRDANAHYFITKYFDKICLFINHENDEEQITKSYVEHKVSQTDIICDVKWMKNRASQLRKQKQIQEQYYKKRREAEQLSAQAAEQQKKQKQVKKREDKKQKTQRKESAPLNAQEAVQNAPQAAVQDKEALRESFNQRKKQFLEEAKRKEKEEAEAAKEQFRLMKERIKEREKQQEKEQQERLAMVLEEMNQLVGLQNVKKEVQSLINLIRVRKMREKHGMPGMDMSYHMVFAGSPGTGKTTVARLVARIYKELGILSKGQLVETDRSGLVAGYVGQTALKVKEVVEQAIGGVLFIDEAYALTNQGMPNDFGTEAIDTLVKLMEDHRDDLVVIVAGYTQEMEEFLKGNTGLVSRFNKFIDFADYSNDELVEILDSMAFCSGMLLEDAAKKEVHNTLAAMPAEQRQAFGNARGIRNMFETIVTNQANRIVEYEEPTIEQLKMITIQDVKEDA